MDLTNCAELAYSEVRAAREAECHYTPQLCSWFKKQCVKNTATRSTSTLFPDQGAACVTQIFEQAYRDVGPTALHGGLAMGGKGQAADGTTASPPPTKGTKLPHPPIGRIPTAASMKTFSETLNGAAAKTRPQPATGLAEVLVEAFGMR